MPSTPLLLRRRGQPSAAASDPLRRRRCQRRQSPQLRCQRPHCQPPHCQPLHWHRRQHRARPAAKKARTPKTHSREVSQHPQLAAEYDRSQRPSAPASPSQTRWRSRRLRRGQRRTDAGARTPSQLSAPRNRPDRTNRRSGVRPSCTRGQRVGGKRSRTPTWPPVMAATPAAAPSPSAPPSQLAAGHEAHEAQGHLGRNPPLVWLPTTSGRVGGQLPAHSAPRPGRRGCERCSASTRGCGGRSTDHIRHRRQQSQPLPAARDGGP